MDELDGKSDLARGLQFDLENNVNILKEQNSLLEKHLDETKA